MKNTTYAGGYVNLSAQRPKRESQPKPLEAEVCDEILTWLRLHGWRVERVTAESYVQHVHVQCPQCGCDFTRGVSRRHKLHETVEEGTPDYLCSKWFGQGLASISFYLETKRPGGKLRPSQKIWHADALGRGIPVCTADSIALVRAWLQRVWTEGREER